MITIKHRYTDVTLMTLELENLRDANLRDANLMGANLMGANLEGANLEGANLRDANLEGANLEGANLRDANLEGASLRYANLMGANLMGASLRYANLMGANLMGANLMGANLRYANLRYANYDKKSFWFSQTRIIPDQGSIIGFKKLHNGIIAKLMIPETASRSHAMGRKCRASEAIVLELTYDGKPVAIGYSQHDNSFGYVVGETVRPSKPFNLDPMEECVPGIHFFITKVEAESY